MSDQPDPRPTEDDAGDMDAISSAGSDVEYMFALTGTGFGTNLNGKITIKDVSATTLYFSDRPYRLTGHVKTEDFVSQWDVGDNNFAEDPPNALLSIFGPTPSTTLWSSSQSHSWTTAIWLRRRGDRWRSGAVRRAGESVHRHDRPPDDRHVGCRG